MTTDWSEYEKLKRDEDAREALEFLIKYVKDKFDIKVSKSSRPRMKSITCLTEKAYIRGGLSLLDSEIPQKEDKK